MSRARVAATLLEMQIVTLISGLVLAVCAALAVGAWERSATSTSRGAPAGDTSRRLLVIGLPDELSIYLLVATEQDRDEVFQELEERMNERPGVWQVLVAGRSPSREILANVGPLPPSFQVFDLRSASERDRLLGSKRAPGPP